MRPSIHQLYPILALLAVAGATAWLDRVTREDPPRPTAAARLDPDFTAEQTRLISFDVDGRQRYELLADRVVNYPYTGVTELERPRLRYDSDGRELRLSAQAGEVSRDGEEVLLTGDVHAARDATASSPTMTFASESLRLWPDDERAVTDDPVVLTQGATTARAKGLKSDNLFGTLQLLGDVTVHMPRSSRTSQ